MTQPASPPQSLLPRRRPATGATLPPLERDGLRARKFRSGRTILALMLREMATTYGKSPGGYLWAVLEPVAALAMFSLGFSIMFSAPPIGNSFPMFYATGFLPFTLFNNTANKIAGAITFSRALLAYPVVTFLDALIARFLLNVLTELMVAYVYDRIARHNPVSFFGMVNVLEGTSIALATRAAGSIRSNAAPAGAPSRASASSVASAA